jgi:hypothetical protein
LLTARARVIDELRIDHDLVIGAASYCTK